MTETNITCTVCGSQRANLNVRKSKLLPSMKLYLCSECEEAQKEPRFIIILVGRSRGPESVAKYIKNRRYEGKEILASELVK